MEVEGLTVAVAVVIVEAVAASVVVVVEPVEDTSAWSQDTTTSPPSPLPQLLHPSSCSPCSPFKQARTQQEGQVGLRRDKRRRSR